MQAAESQILATRRLTSGPRLTRRRFLGAASAAAAGAIGFPNVLRAAAPILSLTGWDGKWGEMVRTLVYPRFEQEFKCKIETDTVSPFVPKLLASSKGRPVYDLLHANSNEQWIAADAGLVEEKIDAENVPNIKDVYPYAVSDKIIGVSIFTSAIGLGYRTDKLAAAPTSWKEIWDPKYANLRASYIVPQNRLGSCFLMMAGQIYGHGLHDIDGALKAMEQLKPIRLVDFTGTMEKILLASEVHIGVIHDSGIWRYLTHKPPLSWTAPKEGVLALEQVYSITKRTDKKELAYAFVNHMLSPKVQKLMSEGLHYSPANRKVTLSPDHDRRLFATEEKVKQLIQADWKWFHANQEQIRVRFNKVFHGA